MEEIIEENPDTHVSSGNGENTGNGEPVSRNHLPAFILDIGGEKVPLSSRHWIYRDKQGKFLVYAHRMEEIIEENPDTHVSSGDGEQEWADYLNKLEAGAEVMPFDAWEEK